MQDLDDFEGLIVHNKYHMDHCESNCDKAIMEVSAQQSPLEHLTTHLSCAAT